MKILAPFLSLYWICAIAFSIYVYQDPPGAEFLSSLRLNVAIDVLGFCTVLVGLRAAYLRYRDKRRHWMLFALYTLATFGGVWLFAIVWVLSLCGMWDATC